MLSLIKPSTTRLSESMYDGSYLQIVVERRDLRAGVVVDMGDPCGVVQVSIEEL